MFCDSVRKIIKTKPRQPVFVCYEKFFNFSISNLAHDLQEFLSLKVHSSGDFLDPFIYRNAR